MVMGEYFPFLPQLSPIRDQFDSPSSAASAIIDCTEAIFRLEYGESLDLKLADDIGVGAHYMPSDPLSVLTHIIEHGLILADQSPYRFIQRSGRCRIYPLRKYDLVCDEAEIMRRMFSRPLVVSADVGEDFRSWVQRTDIYHPPAEPNARFRHVMTLVGFGDDDSGSYWIVKNNFGPAWGHFGFARIERSENNPIVAIDLRFRLVKRMFRFFPICQEIAGKLPRSGC